MSEPSYSSLVNTTLPRIEQASNIQQGKTIKDYRNAPISAKEGGFKGLLMAKMDVGQKQGEGQRVSGAMEDSGIIKYRVQKGDTLWGIAYRKFKVNLEQIVKDNQIEDPDNIQEGQELIIRRPKPMTQHVVASWYGPGYHGRPMANGEIFNMYDNVIAHKELPLGTKVELINPENGKRVMAVVKDRGPFIKGRDVDLSYGLARKLDMVEKGVGPLIMRVLV